jgi:hypothetical protein
MPNEPEREIEKALKAYARKRREQAGAPLELHPATRRLLQSEASRLSPNESGSPGRWRRLLAGWRPRLVLAGSLVILVGALVLLFVPWTFNESDQLSSQSFQPPAGEAPEAARKAAKDTSLLGASPTDRSHAETGNGSASGTFSADKKLVSPNQNGTVSSRQLLTLNLNGVEKAKASATQHGLPTGMTAPLALPPAAASPAPQPTSGIAALAPLAKLAADSSVASTASSAHVDSFKKEGGQREEPAQPAPGSISPAMVTEAPNAAATATIAAGMAGSSSLAVTQQFYRIKAPVTDGKKSGVPKKPAILDSFRLEQTGDHLEIIDADGSRYSGSITLFSAAKESPGAVPASKPRSNRSRTESLQFDASALTNTVSGLIHSYQFRVTGTNRTLKKSVLFTGTLGAGGGPRDNVIADGALADRAVTAGGRLAAGGGAGGGFGGGRMANTNTAKAPPASPVMIQGRVLIGGKQLVNVEATAK